MADLAELIRDEIRRRGPMRFSRWMALSLYHPEHGYYTRAPPPGRRITGTGADADFATPPTLHPFFGACMGREVAQAWRNAACPAEFRVLEFGGGEGDLARDALAWIDRFEPRLGAALRWMHQEMSPQHVAAQQAKGRDPRLSWVREAERAKADVLLSCEVLDCQPFDVYRRGPAGWIEVLVGLDGEAFVEVDGGPLTEGVPYRAEPGDRIALPLYGGTFHDDLANHLRPGGTVLVCDYGGRGAGFLPRPKAFRGHQHVDLVGPGPGTYDITMDVDFARTRAEAADRDKDVAPDWVPLQETSYETMEAFVLRHGILEALNAVDRSTVEGASSYLRLRQLLLPTGMGAAFKVQRFDGAKP